MIGRDCAFKAITKVPEKKKRFPKSPKCQKGNWHRIDRIHIN